MLVLFMCCLAEPIEVERANEVVESEMDAIESVMESRFDKSSSDTGETKPKSTFIAALSQGDQGKGQYKIVARKPSRIRPQGTSSTIYDKGELYPHPAKLYKYYPQSTKLRFRIEPCWMNIIFYVYRNGSLHDETIDALRAANSKLRTMIDLVPELMDVDFSSLREPRVGYADQQVIDPNRVRDDTACLVYYGLDMGLVDRFLGDEYTGRWKDVDRIMTVARPSVKGL